LVALVNLGGNDSVAINAWGRQVQ